MGVSCFNVINQRNSSLGYYFSGNTQIAFSFFAKEETEKDGGKLAERWG